MFKFLRELFYVPKYGKMKESTFFAHLTASVGVIVLSLIAMSFSAYAYFSCSMTTTSNTIVAARFDVDVSVLSNGTELEGAGSYNLSAGTYVFELKRTEDTTASTGYCIINIGNRTYITVQLGADVNAPEGVRNSASFTLVLNGDGNVNVTVTPSWGTPAVYTTMMLDVDLTETDDNYIEDDETIEIDLADIIEPEATEPEVTEPEVTEPEATEPEVTEPEVTEPVVTEPEVTEPVVTEPEVTDPEVTEPISTDSDATEVQADDVTDSDTKEPPLETSDPIETEATEATE